VVQWLASNNPRTQWTFEKDKAITNTLGNASGQVRVCRNAAHDFGYHDFSYRLLTTCPCNPQFHWCDPVREAAPAMLKALEAMVNECRIKGPMKSLPGARAAISAAKGETT
jgi:hypothetical protein